MPQSCVCVDCYNRSSKEKRISFHSFPFDDKDVFAAWLKNINRSPDFKPSTHVKVCSEHFLAEDYVHGIHPREETFIVKHVLKAKAIPTVFPTHTISRPKPRRKLIKHEIPVKRKRKPDSNVQSEHTYSRTEAAEESPKNSKAKVTKIPAEADVLQQTVKRKIVPISILLQDAQQLKMLSQQQVDLLDHNFGPEIRVRIENELECLNSASVSDHGYSENLKKFAVTVHFCSSRAYNYIRDHLYLPDQEIIRRWCSSTNFQPGVLTEAVESLKLKVERNSIDRHCALMLGTMAIKREVVFNDKTKAYEGFVDCGRIETSSSESLVTEALVFMVVGLAGHYKLPIAYYMVDHLPGDVQAEIINQLMHILHDAGMTVHAVVCDGSYANQSIAKTLGCSLYSGSMQPYFQNPASPDDRVYFVFNACHMVKLVRNCLASCGKLYQRDKVIDWDYIKNLHELLKKDSIGLATERKSKHALWERHKTNVESTVQTLSSFVADAIDFLRKDLDHPQFVGSEETCNFIRKIDKLLDLMNSKNATAKAFKHPFRMRNLAKRKDWLFQMVRYFETLKDNQHNRLCTSKNKTPFVGFVATMLSVLELCKKLLQPHHLPYLCTHRLSLDHVETFFSRIRRRCGWNEVPNALQFRLAFRTVFQNDIQTSPHADAARAPEEPLNLLFGQVYSEAAPRLDQDMVKYLELLSSRSEYRDNVLLYISGYFTRTLIKDCRCTLCVISLQRDSSSACSSSELVDWHLANPRSDVFHVVRTADRAYAKAMCEFRLPKHTESKSNLCKRVEINVLEEVLGSVFRDLDEHRKDCDIASEQDHICQLVKAITSLFLTIMLHHQPHFQLVSNRVPCL